MNITKRDGTSANFDSSKIKFAISKANERSKEMTPEDIDKVVSQIVAKCENRENLDVEGIQDIVEHTLLVSKFKATAKQYILYRDQRTRIRQGKLKLMKEVGDKLSGLHVLNQNANMDEASFGGRKGEADSALMKEYALNYCMTEMSRNNHLNNEVYIHDLDMWAVYCHNCLSIPFDDLLANGFKVKQTDVRPAGSISTAFQLLAVIFQLQSLQQFGGVSATHLDWTMVPYVRKSFYKHYVKGLKYIAGIADIDNYLAAFGINKDMSIDNKEYQRYAPVYRYAVDQTIEELDQAVEGMFHNLNTLQSRSGNQLPFTSINYGTCTSAEGRMVIKALLEGAMKGVGKHHLTPIFPCVIFQYMKGVNDKPGTPNYDLYRLALQCTAQRIYPNYCNCEWSNNAGYDKNDPRTYFSTMGKRKLQLI